MTIDPIAPLRARFRERAIEDARRLRAEVSRGAAGLSETERIVHGLAGMAGVFGYGDLGSAAGALDRRFALGDPPGPEAVLDLVERIERVLADYS